MLAQPQFMFLNNLKNKEDFIVQLPQSLESASIEATIAEDTDAYIVHKAVDTYKRYHKETDKLSLCQDVDLIVLFIALAPERKDIVMMKERRGNIKTRFTAWKIYKVIPSFMSVDNQFCSFAQWVAVMLHQPSLEKETSDNSIVQPIPKSPWYTQCVQWSNIEHMRSLNISAKINSHCIPKSGDQLVQTIWIISDFNVLFNEPSKSGEQCCDSFTLLSTADTACLHSHRVCLQIQMWLRNSLDPRTWGWKQQNSLLSPVYMTQALASGMILTLISCGCTLGCERKCKYVEAHLCCTAICHGQSCTNRVPCWLVCWVFLWSFVNQWYYFNPVIIIYSSWTISLWIIFFPLIFHIILPFWHVTYFIKNVKLDNI